MAKGVGATSPIQSKEKIITLRVALPESLYKIILDRADDEVRDTTPEAWISSLLDYVLRPGAEA